MALSLGIPSGPGTVVTERSTEGGLSLPLASTKVKRYRYVVTSGRLYVPGASAKPKVNEEESGVLATPTVVPVTSARGTTASPSVALSITPAVSATSPDGVSTPC